MKRLLPVTLLLLVVSALGFVTWLMASENGLRWAYRSALSHLPGTLAVGELSGRLAGQVVIAELSYEFEDHIVKASSVTLKWDPWALLRAEIKLSNLRIEALEMILPDTEEAPASSVTGAGLPNISLPLGLQFDDTVIDGLSIARGDSGIELRQLRMNAGLNANGIEIGGIEIDSDQFDIGVQGEITTASPFTHDLDLRWRAVLPSGAAVSGEGRLAGNLAATRLTQKLQGALQLDLDLELREPFEQLSWQAVIETDSIDTTRLDARIPPLQAALSLKGKGDRDSAVVTGRVDASASQLGPFGADFELRSLDREQRFDGVYFESLRVKLLESLVSASGQFNWFPVLGWDANATASALNPAQLLPEWPGKIDAEFSSRGKTEDDQLIVDMDISRLQGTLRGYPVSLQSRLQWHGQSIDIASLELSSGETRVKAQGMVGDALSLEWSLDSANLAEIYPGASGYLQASGQLQGRREAPRIRATFQGKSLGLPGYEVAAVDGSVALDLLHWQQLDIDLRAQQLSIQGQGLKSLELKTDTRRVRATLIADDASLDLELNGEIDDQTWRGQISRAEILSKEFSNWKLKSPASVSLSLNSVAAQTICLQSDAGGEICSSAKGKDDDWQFEAEAGQLPLAMLSKWILPGLRPTGLVNARASLNYRFPDQLLGKIDVDLPPASFSYPLRDDQPEKFDYRSGRLEILLEPTGMRANTEIVLSSEDLFEGRIELPGARLLSLDVEKQLIQAEAGLSARDLGVVEALLDGVEELQGQADVRLTLAGTLAEPTLQGRVNLKNASLSIPELNLRFEQVNIRGHSDSSDRFVYQADARSLGGKILLSGHTWLDRKVGWPSEVVIEGDELDLATLLERWLPAEIRIEGRVAARAKLSLPIPGIVYGQVDISSSEGKFRYPLLKNEKQVWDYRDARLALVMTAQGIDANWALLAGNGNRLHGELELPGARLLALDSERQAIRASASLDFRELELIEALVPEIDQLQGSLALDFNLTGTLAQPKLGLRTKISDAALQVPRLGLNIDRINMTGTTAADGRFNFRIGAHSNEGRVVIEGSSLLEAESGWATTFQVKGDNFEIARIPEARVTVSPDLTVKLEHRAIDIQGEIHVPYAKLQPKDISTAAKVSNDTVIIGDERLPESKWSLTTRIRLLLGERVNFFGFGFEGQLGGRVLIEDSPGQLTKGTGTINIISGQYRAYGQRLDVENGRLLFTGGPLTNPGLDIRAVRRSNTVTTGVMVKGRLEQPRLELFSIPAMEQTDILSYLLLGRPLENASGQEGAMMARAALALGVVGGDQISRSLGERFGLDEMRVESDDSGEQASLVVGRYLTPRIYVSYGVGLVESFNTLNLRYQISEKWRFEAASGESQGADLLYTIER